MLKIIHLLKLFRPLNLLLGIITVVISAAVLDELNQTHAIFYSCLVVVSLNAAANAFNDYRDLETDKINRQNRPLSLGIFPPSWALWSSIILFIAGILISTQINTDAFIIAAFVATPIMLAYSLWFKGWPLVGNIVIALILGLTFIFAGASLGDIRGILVPAYLAFGFTLIRELIKDMADIEGDKAAGLNTFPILFGLEKSAILAVTFIILLSIGALFPYWLNIYGKVYLIVLIPGIEIPLLYIIFLLMKYPDTHTCNYISKILKACIFAGLLAVYLG